VIRGNDLNRAAGLEGRALSVQADFMKLAPFADNSFDGVYAIEATCHAPVREGVYSQIYRVLKPGQIFACYEWCLTPKYDPNNELHRTIKKKIEEGDGLPDMASQQECVDALTSVGFEVCLFLALRNANSMGAVPLSTWLWRCCVLCYLPFLPGRHAGLMIALRLLPGCAC
jgi:SAM-dependent methyltransferase